MCIYIYIYIHTLGRRQVPGRGRRLRAAARIPEDQGVGIIRCNMYKHDNNIVLT